MDLNMNRMDGNEATLKVKYLIKIKNLVKNKGFIDCEIIGYSSDYDKAVENVFLKAGACCVVNKPTSLSNFRNLIKKHVLK